MSVPATRSFNVRASASDRVEPPTPAQTPERVQTNLMPIRWIHRRLYSAEVTHGDPAGLFEPARGQGPRLLRRVTGRIRLVVGSDVSSIPECDRRWHRSRRPTGAVGRVRTANRRQSHPRPRSPVPREQEPPLGRLARSKTTSLFQTPRRAPGREVPLGTPETRANPRRQRSAEMSQRAPRPPYKSPEPEPHRVWNSPDFAES
jgi:hypothetical protein